MFDVVAPLVLRCAVIVVFYLIPAIQILLTLTGQYRKNGLLPGYFPYLERWPAASDAVYALLSALPLYLLIRGDPFDAAYFLFLFVPHQLLWLKKRYTAKQDSPQ